MKSIPVEVIQGYRYQTFRLAPEARLRSIPDAAAFVRERGFVYFWPIRQIVLPSLWAAVAGDRPVADEHDDPGHVTWGWKDQSLGGRDWYYAKVLRKKATLISFDLLPYFYALSENYGSFEDDYLTLYEQGRMTAEAKQIYEALLDNGRLDTIELRKIARMSSSVSGSRFDQAVADLQCDFKIMPAAVTQSGGWRYAFAYDITARCYPDVVEQAHAIDELEARFALARAYLRSVGACQVRDLQRLFGWQKVRCERTAADLVRAGEALAGYQIEDQPGEWLITPGLG